MTLSEFDRMCRGYHRRQDAALYRTRLVLAEIRNQQRGPDDAYIPPNEIFSLPVDGFTPPPPEMSSEEYAEALARAADLDKDLF